MPTINMNGIHTAGFLDDLSNVPNSNNVDTSRSKSSQLLRELRLARRDARIIAEEAKGKRKSKGSPYVEDREKYYEVKGTSEETQWKVVGTRESDVKEAQEAEILEARERDLHAARQELNKKKLNII